MPQDINRMHEALIAADKAGDAESATLIAKEIRNASSSPAPASQVPAPEQITNTPKQVSFNDNDLYTSETAKKAYEGMGITPPTLNQLIGIALPGGSVSMPGRATPKITQTKSAPRILDEFGDPAFSSAQPLGIPAGVATADKASTLAQYLKNMGIGAVTGAVTGGLNQSIIDQYKKENALDWAENDLIGTLARGAVFGAGGGALGGVVGPALRTIASGIGGISPGIMQSIIQLLRSKE